MNNITVHDSEQKKTKRMMRYPPEIENKLHPIWQDAKEAFYYELEIVKLTIFKYVAICASIIFLFLWALLNNDFTEFEDMLFGLVGLAPLATAIIWHQCNRFESKHFELKQKLEDKGYKLNIALDGQRRPHNEPLLIERIDKI